MNRLEVVDFVPEVGLYSGDPNYERRCCLEYKEVIEGHTRFGLSRGILQAAKRAKILGRDAVNIFDLGSGMHGRLGLELVRGKAMELSCRSEPPGHRKKNNSLLAHLHGELEELGVGVNYIGVTDAQNASEFGCALYEEAKGRHRAKNIAYSIASGQSVGIILEEEFSQKGLQIDMALAVYSLMYFGTQEFDESVMDITDRMSPGARFIAVGTNVARTGYHSIDHSAYGITSDQIKEMVEWMRGEAERRKRFFEEFQGEFLVSLPHNSTVLRKNVMDGISRK